MAQLKTGSTVGGFPIVTTNDVNIDPSLIDLYNASNDVGEKRIKIELVTEGLQYNLYDDSDVFVETLFTQKYDVSGLKPFIFNDNAVITRERIVGDAGKTAFSDSTTYTWYSSAWQTVLNRSVNYYGSYRLYFEHRELTRRTSYVELLKNGSIIGSWSNSTESFIAHSMDFDILPGDSLLIRHRNGRGDPGEGSQIRNIRFYVDSSTNLNALPLTSGNGEL